MTAAIAVELDEWEGTRYLKRTFSISSPNDIFKVFEQINPSASSQIMLEANDNSLIISTWEGMFTAGVISDNQFAYNMLSKTPSDEKVHFVDGGQSVEIRKRYLISRDQAIAAALDFIANGTVLFWDDWEPQ